MPCALCCACVTEPALVTAAQVEACVSLFNAAVAARLLGDSPALVLDCIDDLPTKAELLGYCHEHGLRVLCALGAGGKADPCQLHLGRLTEVINDPIATTMLRSIRKKEAAQSGRSGGGGVGVASRGALLEARAG